MNYRSKTILLIAVAAFLRVSVMGLTGLGDSEAYYWAWSQNIDWSYFDHPPVTAYIMALFTWLGGPTPFFVRIGSMILFVFVSWMIYLLALKLYPADSGRTAFLSVLIFTLTPLFSIGALQMVPDIPAAFFWMLYLLALHRLLRTDNARLWYAVGVFAGLGMLSKYFNVMLIPATLIYLAFDKRYRKWYRSKELYMAGFTALLFFMPVIWWNYANDFPSFQFHIHDRHSGAGFSWKNTGIYFGGQLGYFSPVLWVLFVYSMVAGWKFARMENESIAAAGPEKNLAPRPAGFLFFHSAPVFLFFSWACLWSNDSEPHWTALAFLSSAIYLAALWTGEAGRPVTPAFDKTVKAGLGIALVLIAIFYIHVFHPILPIKNPKHDIVNELYGWPEAAEKIELYYGELKSQNSDSAVITYHWVLAGQIVFNTRNTIPVYCVNKSFDQFDFFPKTAPDIGADVLFVGDNRFESPPDHKYNFDSVEKMPELEISRGGRVVRTFRFWKCKNYQGMKE